jgi:glucuronokinase
VSRHLALARPRVGLLGNPSDLYQGRVLGFTFDDFAARVAIEPATHVELVGPQGHAIPAGDLGRLEPSELEGGCQLLAAALRRLALHAPGEVLPRSRPFRLTSDSDIPRQVGFSGSSALVIATLRALATWFGVSLDPFQLSELALAAETEELGSVAGPQDRVLQAYEGLLYMDFHEPRSARRYVRLDPGSLPELFLAWDQAPGLDSGAIHAGVRERWLAGDPDTRAAIAVFPRLADEGLETLRTGDRAALADLVDAAFEARAALFTISTGDRERVDLARELGAGATLCGSGGAIVGVPRDPARLAALSERFVRAGHGFLVPRVSAKRP